jgi:leader peptidase (prepilin peptidase) / N-methyltransferase
MNVVLITALAGITGLVFGSFLNVCVSRWPEEKSTVRPRSHCPHCERTLAWWENIPLVSWLALRGRCRSCHVWIGWRYPLVELAVGGLWAFSAWQTLTRVPQQDLGAVSCIILVNGIAQMIFIWLLVGLAALDAENLWLPDRLIFPGIVLGLGLSVVRAYFDAQAVGGSFAEWKHRTGVSLSFWFLGLVVPAGVVLVIRFLYRMFRDQEGIGMGDVKLMAMLGGWMGMRIGLLDFGIGVIAAALFALLLLITPSLRANKTQWAQQKLPFGAFLSLAGIVGGFWGNEILAAYMRWGGL